MPQDLTVEFGDILETPTLFPDEQGRLKVTVTNEGDREVNGASISLFASTDIELDDEVFNALELDEEGEPLEIQKLEGTDERLGTLNNINLNPGESSTFTVDFATEEFTTASVVSPGAYFLIAKADPFNTIAETNEDNNQAVQFISSDNTDVVIDWNSVFLNAVQAEGKRDLANGVELTDTTIPGVAPPILARDAAILHIAIYDAVNALSDNPGSAYLDNLPTAPAGASQEAAAVGAAFTVLSQLFPEDQAVFDDQRDRSLEEINDDPAAEQAGEDFGAQVAQQILDLRSNDFADQAQRDYVPGNDPGDYQAEVENREDPEADLIMIDALLPDWGLVTPFAIDSVVPFRPAGPPAFGSPNYATELEEVRVLGAIEDTAVTDVIRTAEQAEIAQFWAYDREDTFRPPGQWNEIAQEVAIEEANTLEENARLFAQLNIAMADAGIVTWDAKYFYEQLRPIEAIRGASDDGNPNSVEDTEWTPLLGTPPFPDYISGHSAFGGAAAGVLEDFFGDDITFEIPSQELPGISRVYTGSGGNSSFVEAAFDNVDSRLFGGVHVDISNQEGVAIGLAVAADVVQDTLI